MKSRLIVLIAVVFVALIVSGCCVCCFPCGRTRYAYAPAEKPLVKPTPTHITYNVTVSPVPTNATYNATAIPVPSPTVSPVP